MENPKITGVTVTTSKSGTANEYGACSVRINMSDTGGSGIRYYRVYRPYTGGWTDWTYAYTSVTETTNVPFTTFGSSTVSWEIQCKDQAGNISRNLYTYADVRALWNARYGIRD